jgi:hypothetical protein
MHETGQWRDGALTGDTKAAAKVVPERHAVLGACFGESQEGVPAIAAKFTARSGADLRCVHI